MGRVKFKFSIKEITFEYEGDHETGRAISQSMHHTLGSLAEAQNAVIDVTPPEQPRAALPPASPGPAHSLRRKHRNKPKTVTNGQPSADAPPPTNGEQAAPKPARSRRAHGSSFRDQMYPLIREGYFSNSRTSNELNAELSRRGYHFNPKNVASELLWFIQKNYLSRDRNEDGKYAYVKGTNDDFPAGQGGS